MRLKGGGHFSYCMNVHPGEGLEDVLDAIRRHLQRIKTALSPDAPFGLGLRLARRATTELRESPESLDRLAEAMRAADAYAFTINGFPYGAFHGTRVKQNVYLPDWSDPRRFDYTQDLFEVLCALLPDGVDGSVSTVPLGYKPARIAAQATLIRLARHLADLEYRSGKLLHLGLEPEPDCVLETTDETLAFFEELFRQAGADEPLVRRHIGVCVDTCHAALQFEDPAECLRRYTAAGVRISKIQLSAALECDALSIPAESLRAFDDGVYLHQVRSSAGRSWRDLPEWFRAPDPASGTLRIHAHVPLHWEGGDGLRSTRHTLTPPFWEALGAIEHPHIEVETYTFDVLPDAVRHTREVAEDMIHECAWALSHLHEPQPMGKPIGSHNKNLII